MSTNPASAAVRGTRAMSRIDDRVAPPVPAICPEVWLNPLVGQPPALWYSATTQSTEW